MKKIMIVTFIVLIAFILSIAQETKASPEPQFLEVGSGELLWLTTLGNGDVITVSYKQENGIEYAEVVYDSQTGTYTTALPLPNKPSSITVSGCNHYLTIATTVTYSNSEPLYTAQIEVPGNIPCTPSSTVNLPMIVQ